MKFTGMITADLHLTDRVEDEYRWDALHWMSKLIHRADVTDLFVLGDLTDKKDRHSAQLVNRIIRTFREFSCNVWILMGNHDFVDPTMPFFRFWKEEGIEFIWEPTKLTLSDSVYYLIPYTPGPKPNVQWDRGLIKRADFIFLHQPFVGARASGGFRIDKGAKPGFKGAKKSAVIVAGDIHVPQKIGRVEYIGSPYPINFGDDHRPHVCVFGKDGVRKYYEVPTIRKIRVLLRDGENLDDYDLQEGDQLKVTIELPRSEFGSWDKHRKRAEKVAAKALATIFSINMTEKKRPVRQHLDAKEKEALLAEPSDLLDAYAKDRRLEEEVLDAGREILSD